MPFSTEVNQDLQFLQRLDPHHFSIEREGTGLKSIHKRSQFSNFFHWFIHIISFTLIPQNKELDCMTQDILKELGDALLAVTEAEKQLAEKAIRNLSIVIQNNGGSQGNAVNQMLATLAKIQSLPDVRNLSPKNQRLSEEELEDELIEMDDQEDEDAKLETGDPKEAKEAQESDVKAKSPLRQAPMAINFEETRLKDLLHSKTESDVQIRNSFIALLPDLHGTVPLSDDLLGLLKNILQDISSQNLKENLSPGLLACLVKNSLDNSNLVALLFILKDIKSVPLNKELSIALAYGFELHQYFLDGSTSTKEIPIDDMEELIRFFNSESHITQSLIQHLSQDKMRHFVKHLFELAVAQGSHYSLDATRSFAQRDNFSQMISLNNTFGDEYSQIALQTLCQVKDPQLLADICIHEKASDFVLETILQSHPPKKDDPDDTFFQQFLEEVISDSACVENTIKYVMTNACKERQAILAHQLSTYPDTFLVKHFAWIPSQTWGQVQNDHMLIHVIKTVSATHRPIPATFVQGLNADSLFNLIEVDPLAGFWSSLLPLCPRNTQIQFVKKVIDSQSFTHIHTLENIPLDLKVWEEASQLTHISKYSDLRSFEQSPEILAHIVNGQINNSQFLYDFFERNFDEYNRIDQQTACVMHLKKEVFEFNNPHEILHPTWYRFFKALRVLPDQTQAQQLLIHSTLHLFNHPGFTSTHRDCLYTMTRDQMELLPVQQYTKPEIRLLLACLTHQLDDQLLQDANSLYDQKGGEFFNFFELAHQSPPGYSLAEMERLYYCVFEPNVRYLNDFLLWILNRPSMAPVLPTWKWFSEDYRDILELPSIEKDPNIQAHIKRHHLKIR